MNVVPCVTGQRVAGKNHADQTFFHRNRVTDFELRFVAAACDSSMWCLLHFSHCDAPGAARTRSVETQVSSSLQEGLDRPNPSPPVLFYVMRGTLPDAGLKDDEVGV